MLLGCPEPFKKPDGALSKAAQVLALMDARTAKVRNLAIEVRASYYDDKMVRKGKLEIVVQPPSSIFVSALSPTGDMLTALASDGKHFTSFQRGSTECYTGPACQENVGRFLPLPLKSEEVVKLVLGAVPIAKGSPRTLRWDGRAGAYEVGVQTSSGETQRIWVTHGAGLVKRATLTRGKRMVYDIVFENVKKVGRHLLPHRVRVKMARRNIDLKLDIRDAEFDSDEIDAGTFKLSCPEATTPRSLPCRD